MSESHSFGILGGDRRQVFLARALRREGKPVHVSCLEAEDLRPCSPEELAERCDIIVLPLPVTRDGKTLNAPLSPRQAPLDDRLAALFAGKTVLGGMTEKLAASSPLWERARVIDYYAREELIVGNAFLTAEAALGAAITEYEGALFGARCLVTGFGRIGRALCADLRALGARVDCCARKPRDLTAICCMGCGALTYEAIAGHYDLVFNTVPAPVLPAERLSRLGKETLLFELASAPGGIDREAAEGLGLTVKDLPALPGRVSPRAAGELIKETICHISEELTERNVVLT